MEIIRTDGMDEMSTLNDATRFVSASRPVFTYGKYQWSPGDMVVLGYKLTSDSHKVQESSEESTEEVKPKMRNILTAYGYSASFAKGVVPRTYSTGVTLKKGQTLSDLFLYKMHLLNKAVIHGEKVAILDGLNLTAQAGGFKNLTKSQLDGYNETCKNIDDTQIDWGNPRAVRITEVVSYRYDTEKIDLKEEGGKALRSLQIISDERAAKLLQLLNMGAYHNDVDGVFWISVLYGSGERRLVGKALPTGIDSSLLLSKLKPEIYAEKVLPITQQMMNTSFEIFDKYDGFKEVDENTLITAASAWLTQKMHFLNYISSTDKEFKFIVKNIELYEKIGLRREDTRTKDLYALIDEMSEEERKAQTREADEEDAKADTVGVVEEIDPVSEAFEQVVSPH